MILVDTSIWVDHLRRGDGPLARLLEREMVLTHPFVIGELACGAIVNRNRILELLQTLPSIEMAGDAEVLHLIEMRRLYGQGIGWVDAHLLASAMLSHSSLFTSDKKLRVAAESLGVAYGNSGTAGGR